MNVSESEFFHPFRPRGTMVSRTLSMCPGPDPLIQPLHAFVVTTYAHLLILLGPNMIESHECWIITSKFGQQQHTYFVARSKLLLVLLVATRTTPSSPTRGHVSWPPSMTSISNSLRPSLDRGAWSAATALAWRGWPNGATSSHRPREQTRAGPRARAGQGWGKAPA